MPSASAPEVSQLVEHLFRHRAGQIVATLTRIFGAGRLELAEDVAQEALVKALRLWPFQGIPDNPAAWLIQVAKNLALDHLRRDATLREKEQEVRRWSAPARRATPAAPVVHYSDEIQDDQLRLMFLCCHESLPRDARVALTLKTLGGFGVAEIARAFLTPEATIAQRLVRAKRKLRDEPVPFAVPTSADVARRLDSVLDVLYVMFNEGYAAHQGEDLVRHDLVHESLRLTSLLLAAPATAVPKVHALMALMLFQSSRLATRLDAAGNLLLLADQDRAQWDRPMIQQGFYHLQRAGQGAELTEYHLQAGIASCHAQADSFAATDWPAILQLYDLLLDMNPSPIVALNRAVAVGMVHGRVAGLAELDALEEQPALRDYYLLPATRGEFLRQNGQLDAAADCFRHALQRPCTEPERRFLLSRLQQCGGAREG